MWRHIGGPPRGDPRATSIQKAIDGENERRNRANSGGIPTAKPTQHMLVTPQAKAKDDVAISP